jgi:hypothetical protein
MVVLVLGACGVIAAASQRPEFAETPQPITAAEMPMIPAIVVLSFCCAPRSASVRSAVANPH